MGLRNQNIAIKYVASVAGVLSRHESIVLAYIPCSWTNKLNMRLQMIKKKTAQVSLRESAGGIRV